MDVRLKDSEWIILNALWDSEPMDLAGIIERVRVQNPQIAWDYKTYHSYLRILCQKGLIAAEKQGKNNRYRPLITRGQAMDCETDSILGRRAYFGSVSNLVVRMAERGKLTAGEKRELMALAARLSEELD